MGNPKARRQKSGQAKQPFAVEKYYRITSLRDKAGKVTEPGVADLLSVHPLTVRRWIEAGKLRAVKFDREFRIPHSAILELLNKAKTPES
jgi:excisionase family DNA binding protein